MIIMKIKQARESAGLTQDKLAELSGVAQNCISFYERNIQIPQLVTLSRIAKALDCKPHDLFDVEY